MPVSVCIATVALASGISGALFFSPFFLLAVDLEPVEAIGAGLLTEIFGTSFGSYNYARQRVVDFSTARFLLMAAIPAAVGGAFLAHRIDSGVLQIVFGIALILLAAIVLYHSTRKGQAPTKRILDQAARTTVIKARDGEVYEYRVCNRTIGVTLAGVGGFLTGLMSAGLPEITTTQLMLRCHIPPRVAVATAIFVLTVTAVFAAGVHALEAKPAWYVVVWSIPGVTIGAQIGPRLEGKVSPEVAERVMGVLFVMVGTLVIAAQAVD